MTNTNVSASLLNQSWRRLDIKVVIDGEMHVLRWRRGWYVDEVLFDDRRVATSQGFFDRETIFGLSLNTETGGDVRLLLTIDPQIDWDNWTGETRMKGVRLETANEALIALGSLGPSPVEPFRQLYDRAIKAIGLS